MSALPNNPTRLQIKGEFGTVTRATHITQGSLRDAWIKIFGGDGSNYSRDGFAGYGQPVVSNVSGATASTLGGYIDVTFTIDATLLSPANTLVQYQLNTGGTPNSAGWSFASFAQRASGTYTQMINVPNTNDDYWVRVVAYNAFNDEDASDYAGQLTYDTARSSDPIPLQTPTIIYSKYEGDQYFLEWNFTDGVASFEAEYYSDQTGVNNWTGMTASSTVNWGNTSNPKEATWAPVSSGNTNVVIRLRATTAGNTSAWTQTVPQELLDPPSSLSISQPSSTSGTVRASWSNTESEQLQIEWQLNGGAWGSRTTLSAFDTQEDKTYSDGDSVKFRVRYADGTNVSDWAESGTLVVDILTTPPVTGFIANDQGFSHELQWNDPVGNNQNGFEIEWTDGSGYAILDYNVANVNTYSVTQFNVVQNAIGYRIRAKYGTGRSDWAYASV